MQITVEDLYMRCFKIIGKLGTWVSEGIRKGQKKLAS
jgi:hypothetical protein